MALFSTLMQIHKLFLINALVRNGVVEFVHKHILRNLRLEYCGRSW